MKKYFRRTDQFALISVDTENLKIQVNYGTEGIAGCGNTNAPKHVFALNSLEDQTEKLNEITENLFNIGYVETKPQQKFPTSTDDYYDEPVIEISIKDFEAAENIEHFSLITWDEAYEDSPENMLKFFIDNKEKYQHIEYFTFGNMDSEICEMSWIHQCDYSDFFKAFPNIKGFAIQGSDDLTLGEMNLPKLEILEMIGSGLTKQTLDNIQQSNLPNLKKINLFVGDGSYGCDITDSDVKDFLANTNFTNLVNLGICNIGAGNSDAPEFGDILKTIIESKYASQIKVLDISKSLSRDYDAVYLLENIDKLTNIQYIDLCYNFFTAEILEKLKDCHVGINADGTEELDIDKDDGDIYSGPMYTE